MVDQRVQDQVFEAVAKRFGEIEIGPGLDDPDLGPIISKEQRERVEGYVQAGKQEADLLAGGDIPQEDRLRGGFFFEPTLFGGVSPGDRLAREEVFGPAGYTLRTFVDPNDPHTVGLIFEGPGLEKLQEMLQTDEVQEAGKYDGVRFDTLRMLVER